MIKFIDLFCGIGGFRLALESAGMKCIFSAEINPHACQMYEANFGHNPYFDVTKVNPKDIPDFDILCAGFPCQAFSIAGKKLGFNEARGTLFFEICRIVEAKKPKVLILENVKNLLVHDNKNTFKVILNSLNSIGYNVQFRLLNAKDFGVPQSRERVIIIATRKDEKEFDFNLVKQSKPIALESILTHQDTYLDSSLYTLLEKRTLQKTGLIFSGYLNKNIRISGVRPGTLHLSRTHKQNNRIYCATGVNPTLSSQETSGRYYVSFGDKVRKLNLDECFKLMGFPDDFKKIGSQSNLYQRIGNSVCVPMVKAVVKSIKKQLF
jgi:DNA (cytosine-5)-methyltransferase 1